MFLGATGSAFISASNGGLQISSSNFQVKGGGDVIMKGNVTAEGGSIGGWTIGSSTLTGGSVTLNSGGSIKVGGLADATTTDDSTSGFFADNSGNVLIKGNVSNNNYIKIYQYLYIDGSFNI